MQFSARRRTRGHLVCTLRVRAARRVFTQLLNVDYNPLKREYTDWLISRFDNGSFALRHFILCAILQREE